MSTSALHRLIDPEALVLFDGAMGTMLYAKGVFINQCYDELNVRAPDLVRDVHRAYVKAGAEVLETNSFGANRVKLAQFGLAEQVHELNRRAAELAREAAESGRDVLVAGAVGPLGIRIEPYGPTSSEEARAFFREQIEGLKAGGADCFILETFGDIQEIGQAIAAARDVDPTMPVIAQMTIGADGRTPYGASPEDVVRALDRFGADVIGLNCSVGPQTILEAIEKMVPLTRKKLSAQPNAGMPRDVGGRSMYMASAEYMAEYARHLVHAGAKVVGGCCGTTPEHIRAMCEFVRPLSPRFAQPGGGVSIRRRTSRGARRRASRAGRAGGAARAALALGRRSSPPARSSRRSRSCRRVAWTRRACSPMCGKLKVAGVDAVNVPDGPRAQSRMGALLTSLLIEQQVGIETVTHYACRDRNLLGMLSDLLGASAIGLRNLLLITGDPPKMGPYPSATAVFDIDAIGLTNLVRNLNHGRDPGDNAIGKPTEFVIGVGVNPAPIDLEHELKRFAWKLEAGAEFAVTQPVFDAAQLENFLTSHRGTAAADRRRHLAARERAQRGVPGERGAGRERAGERDRADASREREVEGARRRRGDRDRARDARSRARWRAGRAGLGAVREGGAGARGLRRHPRAGRAESPVSRASISA